MSKIYDFLKEAGVFFIATEDGDQARVRPFGLVFEYEDKLYFGVGDFKPSCKQLVNNPKFEISAVKNNNNEWIRLTAKAVFDDRPEVAEEAWKAAPHLKETYTQKNGPRLALFYADDVEAYAFDMNGKNEKLD